jgi:hypothetical protein
MFSFFLKYTRMKPIPPQIAPIDAINNIIPAGTISGFRICSEACCIVHPQPEPRPKRSLSCLDVTAISPRYPALSL